MQPARVVLDGNGAPGRPAERDALGRQIPARVAVAPDWVARLQTGDTIKILDSRGHEREMKVRVRISEQEVLADAQAGIYLTPDTSLAVERETAGGMEAFAAPVWPDTPAPHGYPRRQGDLLRLTRHPRRANRRAWTRTPTKSCPPTFLPAIGSARLSGGGTTGLHR